MKTTLLLLAWIFFIILTFISCKGEDLINAALGANKSTTIDSLSNTNTAPTTKCYVKEMIETENGDSFTTKFTYNTKNLVEKIDADSSISTYTYNANNIVTKLAIVDGASTQTFTYTYDGKGNISKVIYDAKGTAFDILIKEYNFTTNANGQVTKVNAVTPDNKIDFGFEYDTKNNLKKLIATASGQSTTLIENFTFDDKQNVYFNIGLNKVHIPLVLLGILIGENLSYFINTNNILTDTSVAFFSNDYSKTTYKYEYTKDSFPSKKSFITTLGSDKFTGITTYTYDCK